MSGVVLNVEGDEFLVLLERFTFQAVKAEGQRWQVHLRTPETERPDLLPLLQSFASKGKLP